MEECHAASSAAAMGVSSYWLVEVPCSAEAHQPPANLLLVQEAPLGAGLGSSLPIPAPYRELSGGLCVKSIASFLCHKQYWVRFSPLHLFLKSNPSNYMSLKHSDI